MNNDLKIRIVSSLNVGKSINEINTAIRGIEKKINKLRLKVDIDNNIKQIKDISKAINSLQNQGNKQGKGIKVVNDADVKTSKEIFTNIESAVEHFKQFGQVKINKIFDPATQELKKFNLEIQKADGLIEKLSFQTTNSQGVNGVEGFLLTNKQEIDKRAIETEKALSKTLQNRAKEERRIAEEQAKAINKNIELTQKEKQKESEKRVELEHQLQLYKQQAAINVANLKRKYKDSDVDTGGLDGYLKQVNQLQSDTPNVKKQMDNLGMSFKKLSADVKASTSHTLSFSDQMKIAFDRTIIWTTATTAIFGTIRLLQQWYDTISLIDQKLISIQKVSDNLNVSEALDKATENAYKFGRTIDGALTSMEEISKLGFGQKDTEALSKNSLLLSTIGDIGDADAANYLVAIMRQYNQTVEDTSKTVDVLNELSNKTGSSVLDLAQALSKSSSSAQVAGIEFNDLAAMSSSVIETLKIGGNEAGNFFKTLSTRLLREDTLKDLEKLGLTVRENNGDIVSGTKIIQDLSKVFDQLSDTQKNAIAQSLGGVYHINKVTTLLQQQANITKYADIANNSFGSGLRELQTFEEGLEFKTNVLKTSMQELAMTFSQAGGRDGAILLIEGFTKSIQAFNDFSKATDGWNIKLPVLVAGIYGVVKAVTLLSTVAKGAKFSLGWLAVAVVGIEVLGTAIAGVSKSNEQAANAFIETGKKYSDNADRLSVLAKRYDELKPQLANNTKAQEEYKQVLDEITQIAPQVTEVTGKYGDVIDINRDKLSDYTDTLKTMSDEQLKNATILLENSLVNAQNELDKLQRKQGKSGEEIQKQFNFIQKMNDKYDISSLSEFAKKYDDMVAKHGLMSSEVRKMADEYGRYNNILTLNADDLKDYSDIMAKVQEKESEVSDLKNRQQELTKLSGGYKELSNTIKETFDGKIDSNIFGNFDTSQMNALVDFGKQTKANNGEFQKFIPILQKAKLSQEQIDSVTKALTSTVQSSTGAIDEYSDSVDGANQSEQDKLSTTERLLGVTEDQMSQAKDAVAVYQLLADAEGLNATQSEELANAVAYLSEMYPHLVNGKELNIEAIQNEIRANEVLKNAFELLAEGKLSSENAMTLAAAQASKNRIDIMKTELDFLQKMIRAIQIVVAETDSIDLDQQNRMTSAMKRATELTSSISIETGSYKSIIDNLAKGIDFKGYLTPEKPDKKDTKKGDKKSGSKSSNKPVSQYLSSAYESNQAKYNDQLDASEHKLESLKDTTEAYRKELANQLTITKNLMKVNEDEKARLTKRNASLSSLLKGMGDFNKLSNEQKELYNSRKKEYDDNEKSILSLTQGNRDYVKSLDDINKAIKDSKLAEIAEEQAKALKKVTETMANYEATLAKIDKQLKDSERTQSRYETGSKEWIAEVNKQNEILEKKKKLILEERDALRKSLREDNLSAEEKANLKQKIDELSTSYGELTDSIYDNNKTLADARADMADKVIDTVKKAIETERDLKLAAIDDEIEALDKAFQHKMDLIDKEENARDYNKDLSKMQKEQMDLQSKINVLALDNSQEAKAKRLELQKQLADLTEQIEEKQHDRSVELQKESLQDQYDNMKDAKDDERKLTDRKYSEMLNDERYFAKLREDIIAGNLDNIQTLLGGFLTTFQGVNETVAQQIGMSWQGLLNIIDSVKSAQGSLGLDASGTPTSQSTKHGIKTGTFHNQSDAQRVADILISQYGGKASLLNEGGLFRVTSEFDSLQRAEDVLARIKERGLISAGYTFHDGGIVGGKGSRLATLFNNLSNMKPSESFGKLLNGEVVMNDNKLLNLLGHLRNVAMPNFNNTAATGGGITIDNLVKIENFNGTKAEADSLSNTIVNKLKNLGKL